VADAQPDPPSIPLPAAVPLEDQAAVQPVPLWTQLFRFVVSGGISACVDFGIYVALLAAGLHVVPAKSVSYIAGTTTAYALNRRWTFRAPPSVARLVAFWVLYGITFVVQVGINALLFHAFPHEWWRIPLAFAIAQGTATVINFVVQRAVIFRFR